MPPILRSCGSKSRIAKSKTSTTAPLVCETAQPHIVTYGHNGSLPLLRGEGLTRCDGSGLAIANGGIQTHEPKRQPRATGDRDGTRGSGRPPRRPFRRRPWRRWRGWWRWTQGAQGRQAGEKSGTDEVGVRRCRAGAPGWPMTENDANSFWVTRVHVHYAAICPGCRPAQTHTGEQRLTRSLPIKVKCQMSMCASSHSDSGSSQFCHRHFMSQNVTTSPFPHRSPPSPWASSKRTTRGPPTPARPVPVAGTPQRCLQRTTQPHQTGTHTHTQRTKYKNTALVVI